MNNPLSEVNIFDVDENHQKFLEFYGDSIEKFAKRVNDRADRQIWEWCVLSEVRGQHKQHQHNRNNGGFNHG